MTSPDSELYLWGNGAALRVYTDGTETAGATRWAEALR